MTSSSHHKSNLIPIANRDWREARPRIEAAIHHDFSSYPWSRTRRDKAIADLTAAVWVAWHQLIRSGNDPDQLGIAVIVKSTCREVNNRPASVTSPILGRHLGNNDRRRALKAHPFSSARARRSPQSGPPVQIGGRVLRLPIVCIPLINFPRLDFAAGFVTLTGPKRRVAPFLVTQFTSKKVARRLQVIQPHFGPWNTRAHQKNNRLRPNRLLSRNVDPLHT